MTLTEYQEYTKRTGPNDDDNKVIIARLYSANRYPSRPFECIHAALGLASEVGELVDTIKKTVIYNKNLDFENLKEEVGDIMWYLSLVSNACGFSIQEAIEHNVDKLKLRYPEKFTEKDAVERKDKQNEINKVS